jgi:hypothetical protein
VTYVFITLPISSTTLFLKTSNLQIIEPTISQYTPFNNIVTQIIEESEAVVAYDTSIKSNQFGGY